MSDQETQGIQEIQVPDWTGEKASDDRLSPEVLERIRAAVGEAEQEEDERLVDEP